MYPAHIAPGSIHSISGGGREIGVASGRTRASGTLALADTTARGGDAMALRGEREEENVQGVK